MNIFQHLSLGVDELTLHPIALNGVKPRLQQVLNFLVVLQPGAQEKDVAGLTAALGVDQH